MKHHDLFRRYPNRAIHVLGILAALSLVHVPVNAQSPFPMPKRLDRFHVVVDGNIVKANYIDGYEGYGIHPYTKAQLGGSSVPGGVALSKQLAINTKNGVVVADAVQKISARQIAKGIGTLASGPVGWALVGAPLILDLIDSLNFEVQPDGTVRKPDPALCFTNCRQFDSLHDGITVYTKSPAEAAAWLIGKTVYGCRVDTATPNYNPTTFALSVSVVGKSTPTFTQACSQTVNHLSQPRAADPPGATVPATPLEIENAITAANPSPAVLDELVKSGQAPLPDPADTPAIQNPAPSQEKTTTTTNPDGSTSTEVCKTNATPTGNTLKLTEACTITKRDPAGNITETSTKTSEDSTGTANTEPSMLCTLFPKIVACAELDTPTDDIPKKTETVDFDAEDIGFGPGQCPPPFAWNDSLGAHELDLAAYCNALENYIQPIVVLMAAFAAFMIVAGGINRE